MIRLVFLTCTLLLAVAPAAGQGKRPAPAAAPAAPFAFDGIVAAGDRTLVCVTTVAEKRSRWIAVGASADGIAVRDYNPTARTIVVEYAGQSHPLTLKSARPLVAQGAGGLQDPLPVATVAAPVAVTNEQKERDARFLVSDLLEIGMIQRKAYEEAQRKKAAEGRQSDRQESAGDEAAPAEETADPEA